MFNEPPAPRRSPLAAAISLVLHGSAIAAIAVIGTSEVFSPRVDAPRQLTFLMFPPPSVPVEVTQLELPDVARQQLETPPMPDAVAIELPAPEPLAPPPPIPEPVAPPLPKIAAAIMPPKPRPAVTLGAFANAAAAPVVDARRDVKVAGFDTAAAVAPDLKLKTAAVGAFDAQPSKAARPGTDRPGVVAVGFEGSAAQSQQSVPRTVVSTGFGATATQPQQNAPRAVTSSGFGAAAAQPVQAARESVKAAGFSEVRQTAAAAPSQRRPDPGTPVEVLFKPTPAYTEEARANRVEGDVILEVDFTAANEVRVVRVVRGLGHGLDDMARQAAEKIRFKPALSGGKPVDVRATVTIVFRLA